MPAAPPLTSDHLRALSTAIATSQLALGRALGIDDREIAAVAFVAYADPAPRIADLREHLGLSAAATTELVDRMERVGHLRRHTDPDDRRVVRLRVPASTRRRIARHLEPQLSRIERIIDDLRPSDRARIARFLEQVTTVYASPSAPTPARTSVAGRRPTDPGVTR